MHAAATRELVGPERRRDRQDVAESGDGRSGGWLAEAETRSWLTSDGTVPTTARALGRRVPALASRWSWPPARPSGGQVSAHTRVMTLLGFQVRSLAPGRAAG